MNSYEYLENLSSPYMFPVRRYYRSPIESRMNVRQVHFDIELNQPEIKTKLVRDNFGHRFQVPCDTIVPELYNNGGFRSDFL
jgi:hypothetical protein